MSSPLPALFYVTIFRESGRGAVVARTAGGREVASSILVALTRLIKYESERENKMKLTVYATRDCPYCIALKDWLTRRGVEFEYYLIDLDPEKAEEMRNLSEGWKTVPFSTIEHDGKIEKIMGSNRVRFRRVLKKYGK